MSSQKFIIRKALIEDSGKIAQLHIKIIKAGFLSKLGKKLLTGIYLFIITSSESFCFVAESNSKIIGFLSATENCNLLYKRFFQKNFFWGLKIIMTKIFDLQVLRKSIDHLFMPRKRVSLPSAEFLTISVDNDIKRRGLGTQLFNAMKDEFKRRKVKKFIVIVGQSLTESNSFMNKMSAKKISEIEVHSGEKSNVYLWD